MSELDFACLKLSVAMKNPLAVERKITNEIDRILACKKKWIELSLQSTQKKKLLCLARR